MPKKTVIYLGADHGGFTLKEKIKVYLDKKGIAWQDLGNVKFVPTDDYPDFVFPVAQAVAKNHQARGIVICRSGVGACIAANKVKGVRAVNVDSVKVAEMSRRHNNTNVLCLGADYVSFNLARQIINRWLKVPFAGGRHARRLRKISAWENKQ